MKANLTRLYDTKGRRYRQHTILEDTILRPMDEDWSWLEFLHRIGDQSSASLRILTEKQRKNRGRALNRMAQLRNCQFGEYGGPVFYYPEQQHVGAATKQDIDKRLICYSIHKKYGIRALKDAGKFQRYAPTSAYREWPHFFMDSWLSASIFFAVRQSPDLYRFHFHDEIVERLHGQTDFEVAYEYKTLEGATRFREKAIIRPDRFFSVEYLPSKEERLFIQETDRGSERTDTDKLDVKSYRHTNYAYKTLIGEGHYRRKYFPHWQKFFVLNTFTSLRRMQSAGNSMLHISDEAGCNFMLYKHLPAFGKYFDPIPPDSSIFHQSWFRAGQPAIHINKI